MDNGYYLVKGMGNMVFHEPEVEFIAIDLSEAVLTTSGGCIDCSEDSGFTGGGMICFGSMEVSGGCEDEIAMALEG